MGDKCVYDAVVEKKIRWLAPVGTEGQTEN